MSSAVIWYWLLPMSGDSALRAWSSWAWTVTASRSFTGAAASAATAREGRLARVRAKVMVVASREGFMADRLWKGPLGIECYFVTVRGESCA